MKIVLVTPLDYTTFDNIEHYMVRYYVERGDDVTVISKVMNRSTAPLAMLWQTVSCTSRRERREGFDVLYVDPLFNYYAGLRRAAETQAADETAAPPSHLRRAKLALTRLLTPLSVLRDVFFLPCFLAVALARCPKADVCIGMGPWGSLLAYALARLGRAKLWMYKDRDYEPGLIPDRLRQGYTHRLEQALVRRADLLVTIGYRLGDLRYAQSGRRALFVPTGVDWARFAPVRAHARTGHTLVYVGKLVPWSGLEVVIGALPAIAAAVPDARLRVIGDDLASVRDKLRALAGSLGVADRVTFCGAVPHDRIATSLAADADIGLANSEPIPYRQYAFPLKVIEYMAAGIPVIATADTESAEILARADCGVAAPYDRQGFAAAAIALLQDGDRRRRYGENGIRGSEEMAWPTVLGRERALMVDALARLGTGAAPSHAEAI